MVSLSKQPGSTSFSPNMKYLLHTLVSLRNDKKKFREGMSYFEKCIKQHFPEMLDMIYGIAEGSGVDFEDVLFLNVATDVMMTCSIWGASGSTTKNSNVLIGMNADESKEVEKYELIIHLNPSEGKRVKGTVMAGIVMLNHGMNESGLAFASTLYFLDIHGLIDGNIPYLVLQKVLFKCDTALEAAEMIDGLPNTNTGIVVYLGDSKKLIRYECSNITREKEWIIDNMKGNTNIPEAQSIRKQDLFETYKDKQNMNANHRNVRMKALIAEYNGNIDIEAMKVIASDHGDQGEHKNKSICQHGKVKTLVSYIADPAEKCMYISLGNPCEGEYKKITFNE